MYACGHIWGAIWRAGREEGVIGSMGGGCFGDMPCCCPLLPAYVAND